VFHIKKIWYELPNYIKNELLEPPKGGISTRNKYFTEKSRIGVKVRRGGG